MHETRNDLALDARQAVILALNDRLADILDLQAQAKQAHWNVIGPSFIALHELFDNVAEEAEDHADLIAERVVALGGIAEGRVQATARNTTLAPYPESPASGLDHVAAVADALAGSGRQIRAAIAIAEDAGDAGTADLFTEVSRGLDKSLWFVEAHLRDSRHEADRRDEPLREAG